MGCSPTPNSVILEVTPQSLWDSPVPIPAFLRGLEALTDESGASLHTCIILNGPELGYTGNDEQILAHTLHIYIDGRKITQVIFASLTWFSPTYCFDHSHAGHGLHIADIQFETISGKSYTYMWAFSLTIDDDGNSTVAYPDSLQS